MDGGRTGTCDLNVPEFYPTRSSSPNSFTLFLSIYQAVHIFPTIPETTVVPW